MTRFLPLIGLVILGIVLAAVVVVERRGEMSVDSLHFAVFEQKPTTLDENGSVTAFRVASEWEANCVLWNSEDNELVAYDTEDCRNWYTVSTGIPSNCLLWDPIKEHAYIWPENCNHFTVRPVNTESVELPHPHDLP